MVSNQSEKDLFSQTLDSEENRRGIRSFVIREGRMTDAQHKAFDCLWPVYGIDELSDLKRITDYHHFSLDIGFGNGESLLHAAKLEPDTIHIGVEVHRPGIGNLLLKVQEQNIDNIRIIHADAERFVKFIPNGFIDRALIFFPDPWPKKRHHKRRLVKESFIEALYPKIKANGFLHMATDWQPYAEQMVEVIYKVNQSNVCPFKSMATNDGANCCELEFEQINTQTPEQFPFISRPEYRPMTKYERRGVKLGHEVFDLIFQKVKSD